MKEQIVTFETAKTAKEKGFSSIEVLTYFYTNPRSKMFGLDEHGRPYKIKNTSNKLYKVGEHAALKIENVIEATTQSLLQKWLRDEHNIDCIVSPFMGKRKIHGYHSYICMGESWELIGYSYTNYEDALELSLIAALQKITV